MLMLAAPAARPRPRPWLQPPLLLLIVMVVMAFELLHGGVAVSARPACMVHRTCVSCALLRMFGPLTLLALFRDHQEAL